MCVCVFIVRQKHHHHHPSPHTYVGGAGNCGCGKPCASYEFLYSSEYVLYMGAKISTFTFSLLPLVGNVETFWKTYFGVGDKTFLCYVRALLRVNCIYGATLKKNPFVGLLGIYMHACICYTVLCVSTQQHWIHLHKSYIYPKKKNPPNTLIHMTSNQARLPAELKHINKRRKRN